MSVEQRLIDALRVADDLAPSPDLWSRVVHSIEEDRAHRRRIVWSICSVVAVIAALVAAGWLGLDDRGVGRRVDPWLFEVLETVALVAIAAVLGPAIRRFGRGYAEDLFVTSPTTARSLLRLLDVAYWLVVGGFVLLTADFDIGTVHVVLEGQLQHSFDRIGGLLIVTGLLHAATIMALPVVALVFNSTRAGRALPRWVTVIIVLAGLAVGSQLFFTVLGLIFGGSGE